MRKRIFCATFIRCLVSLCLVTSCQQALRAAENYRLEEPVDDSRVFGVGTRVNVSGKTQPSPKVEPLKLVAEAKLTYRERRLLGPGTESESFRSVRDYELAEANIEVGGDRSTTRIDDRLKVVVAQGRSDGVELYSLGGPLNSDELDLIRSPADSLALIALLPKEEVSIGDKWTAPSWAFQMLTATDAITSGELTCTLSSVENQVAVIKMAGKLKGASLSAVSEVTIAGQYEYSLKDRYISKCDFNQEEKRGLGPVSPAFEFKANVRMLRQPTTVAGKLSDAKIIDRASGTTPENASSLRFDSPWNIGIEYPRHWHLWKRQEKSAIFRLLDQGNFIAQCDLAPIAAAKPGQHLSEQDFQKDIKQVLSNRLESLGVGEDLSKSGRNYIYRVTATGTESDRKLTWIFYLIADPTGRQASLTVTVDTPLLETLAGREKELIDTMRFGPAPQPSGLRPSSK